MRTSALLFSLAALTSAGSLQANLIVNGSFETTRLEAGNLFTNGGWDPDILVLSNSSGAPFPGAFDGTHYADISNATGPRYSSVFSVTTAGSYTLSWAANTGYYGNLITGNSPYTVSILSAAMAFAMPETEFQAFNFGEWKEESVLVTLTSGDYVLAFAPQGVFGGYDTLIDAVSLVESNPSASVPDQASTVVLLFGGVASLFLARRRAYV